LLEVALFFDKNSPSSNQILETVFNELSKLESLGIRVTKLEKSSLSSPQMERVVDEIRQIKPQSRGSVVASGGRFLPISGSKKLNLLNTAVLLVRKIDGKTSPVYVFPCKVGERYYGVLEGILFVSTSYPNLGELPGEMEESLVNLLKNDPSKLEEGLTLRSSDDTLRTGKTDLVFSDVRSQTLLIEVEREATDSAIGQVLRLAAGYEMDHGSEKVRCGIACFRINDNVLMAANRAGIEVWRAQGQGKKFQKVSKD